jgi:UrcA family protein
MYRFTSTMMVFALALGFDLAHAASPQDAPSVIVHFADLDLSHGQAAGVLYQRLKETAETLCAPLDDRDLGAHLRFKACVQNAISTAVVKVDRPTLTAYYKARTSGHNAATQIAQNQVR